MCSGESGLEEVIKENAIHGSNELQRCSTIIRNAVHSECDNKKVKIETTYYYLATGEVEFFKKSSC